MTAESLKPFISLPSGENFSSQKRSPHNLITIGLNASFVVLSIVLLGFTIWNSICIGELQREVSSLNMIIGSMQKRLGIDYLEGLNEFENAYDNVLVDDPNPYSRSDEDNDDDDDDDDDDDENSDEDGGTKGIPNILEDYGDDDILDGSGQYDDDDDDDDMDDSSYDNGFDDFEKPAATGKELLKERRTRSISSSSNGIPIYQDSYALKRNRTGGPEDERIEHHLLANKSPTPTLRYDWSEKSPRPPSVEQGVSEERRRYQSAPNNMLRSLNAPRHRGIRRHRNQGLLRPLLRSGKPRGKPQALRAMPSPRFTAIHYHLNNTISGRHILHPEHNKLPHDGDVYIGSPHPWARTLGMDKAFNLNHGVLTAKEPGLYFIYAQIYYDNRFDRNGYVIYHNVHPFLQCALFVPTNTVKSHTCYTSGVIYLESNDELHLRDIHQDRVVMLTNAKSFFGIIKLGEI